MKYNFCSTCGKKLEPAKIPFCPNCKINYYNNSKPCVGAIIYNKKGEVLLTKRSIPPIGKIDIPGGFLENGEDPINGLKREVREEIGVDISIGEITGIYIDKYENKQDCYTLNIYYACRIVSGIPKAKDEITEVKWYQKDEIKKKDLAFKNTGKALYNFFQKVSNQNPTACLKA